MLFWLSETGKIWGFQAFWSCSVDFPHYGDPLVEIGHSWRFWRTCGSKCRGEGGGIFLTLCVECCLVLRMVLEVLVTVWLLGNLWLQLQSMVAVVYTGLLYTSICKVSNDNFRNSWWWTISIIYRVHVFCCEIYSKYIYICIYIYIYALVQQARNSIMYS